MGHTAPAPGTEQKLWIHKRKKLEDCNFLSFTLRRVQCDFTLERMSPRWMESDPLKHWELGLCLTLQREKGWGEAEPALGCILLWRTGYSSRDAPSCLVIRLISPLKYYLRACLVVLSPHIRRAFCRHSSISILVSTKARHCHVVSPLSF